MMLKRSWSATVSAIAGSRRICLILDTLSRPDERSATRNRDQRTTRRARSPIDAHSATGFAVGGIALGTRFEIAGIVIRYA